MKGHIEVFMEADEHVCFHDKDIGYYTGSLLSITDFQVS